jgi:hypothetical protein
MILYLFTKIEILKAANMALERKKRDTKSTNLPKELSEMTEVIKKLTRAA